METSTKNGYTLRCEKRLNNKHIEAWFAEYKQTRTITKDATKKKGLFQFWEKKQPKEETTEEWVSFEISPLGKISHNNTGFSNKGIAVGHINRFTEPIQE